MLLVVLIDSWCTVIIRGPVWGLEFSMKPTSECSSPFFNRLDCMYQISVHMRVVQKTVFKSTTLPFSSRGKTSTNPATTPKTRNGRVQQSKHAKCNPGIPEIKSPELTVPKGKWWHVLLFVFAVRLSQSHSICSFYIPVLNIKRNVH